MSGILSEAALTDMSGNWFSLGDDSTPFELHMSDICLKWQVMTRVAINSFTF